MNDAIQNQNIRECRCRVCGRQNGHAGFCPDFVADPVLSPPAEPRATDDRTWCPHCECKTLTAEDICAECLGSKLPGVDPPRTGTTVLDFKGEIEFLQDLEHKRGIFATAEPTCPECGSKVKGANHAHPCGNIWHEMYPDAPEPLKDVLDSLCPGVAKRNRPSWAVPWPVASTADGFNKFWSSTNNSNYFKNTQITVEILKQVAGEAWKAAIAEAKFTELLSAPQYPHHVHCNVFRSEPIGCAGCICEVVVKKEREQDIARLAELEKASDEMAVAFNCLIENKPLPNGQYVHSVICSGDRRYPAGMYGHCCSCRMTPRDQARRDVKDLERSRDVWKQMALNTQQRITSDKKFHAKVVHELEKQVKELSISSPTDSQKESLDSKAFTFRWDNNMQGYKVNLPNFNGGLVVRLEHAKAFSQQYVTLLQQLICPHKNIRGGNDYTECTDCDLEWDYRKNFPIYEVQKRAAKLLEAK